MQRNAGEVTLAQFRVLGKIKPHKIARGGPETHVIISCRVFLTTGFQINGGSLLQGVTSLITTFSA